MKTDNEWLKEIFSKHLGQGTDTPDFESMWQRASEVKKKKRLLLYRFAASAASVALVVSLGTMLLYRPGNREYVGFQMKSWREPTRILNPSQKEGQLTAITHWTSPTNFLLPYNNKTKK